MEDYRWYVGSGKCGRIRKTHKQSDMVNRDGPGEETEKGQKEDSEEIRHEWTMCR